MLITIVLVGLIVLVLSAAQAYNVLMDSHIEVEEEANCEVDKALQDSPVDSKEDKGPKEDEDKIQQDGIADLSDLLDSLRYSQATSAPAVPVKETPSPKKKKSKKKKKAKKK